MNAIRLIITTCVLSAIVTFIVRGDVYAQVTFQPSAPYHATFFYLWYKNPNTDDGWSYWTDHGKTPPQTWFSHYLPDVVTDAFDPATELYSSSNYDVFTWQAATLKRARIEVAIASWWGQNRKEDAALQHIIGDFMGRPDNPYPDLRWAIYYENEAFGDPSVSTLVSDLNHIANTFASSPYYLKVSGKPVVFVYAGDTDTPGTMMSRWEQAMDQVGNQFYLVLKVFPGFEEGTFQPSSWHQYAPAVRFGQHSPYAAFVSPGFWLDDGSSVRLERNIAEFSAAVDQLVSANVTWKLIQTWNEWGEGTSVEPGHKVRYNASTQRDEIDPDGPEFGDAYITILSQKLPPLEGQSNASPTPDECMADINSDGIVDLSDYSLLVSSFLTTHSGPADINGDGIVDISDYSRLVSSFLHICG